MLNFPHYQQRRKNVLIWSIELNNIYPVYHVYLQEAFSTVNNFYPSKKHLLWGNQSSI